METGKLLRIWAKEKRGGAMCPLEQANFVKGKGMTEDVNFGKRRQVTIIEQEKWNVVQKNLNADLAPEARRANLLISGINLENSRGLIVRIGACRIEILGETKPCNKINQQFEGLKDALKPNWNGGVFGKVLDSGVISVGDEVVLETERPEEDQQTLFAT